MKKTIVVLILLSLSSCAKREMTQYDVDIAASQSASRVACYDKQAQSKPDMKSWTADQIVAYEREQTIKDSMKLLAKVPLDPCATETNVYDAEKAVAQENSKQTAVIGSWGEKLLSSALIGWGIYEVADVVKTMSNNGGIKFTGDKNTLESVGNKGNEWSFTKSPTTETNLGVEALGITPAAEPVL